MKSKHRNAWWAIARWGDARWRCAWNEPSPFRRYWRRRMTDLARTLDQRYGIGVETLP